MMPRVLVVEDEVNIRKFVAINLSARGFDVIEAQDAGEGLARLRDSAPAILLLDIKLPDMSGWDLLEIMAGDPTIQEIPVVVITAKDLTEEDLRRLNGGVERIIQKGATSQSEVLELVRSTMQSYVGENI